ncbi:peptidoglycan DD-metalloendopeptidase family protein [Hirschia litorea]|uniref:Peptidoglycan DD-metalloendopeptidase family protein n=1 Tax=Hirschia litorea TaxID=1199156 RepID=A0ABW2IHF5_9PROT
MSGEKLVSARHVLTISFAIIVATAGQAVSSAWAQSKESAPVEFKTASQYSQYRVPEVAESAPVIQGDARVQPNVQYYENVARASEQEKLQRQAAQAAQQQADFIAQQRQYQNAQLHEQARLQALQSQSVTQQGAPINYGQAQTQPYAQQDMSQVGNGFSDTFVDAPPRTTQRQVFQGQYANPASANQGYGTQQPPAAQGYSAPIPHGYQEHTVNGAGAEVRPNIAHSANTYPSASKQAIALPDMSQPIGADGNFLRSGVSASSNIGQAGAVGLTSHVGNTSVMGAPTVVTGATALTTRAGYGVSDQSKKLFSNKKIENHYAAPAYANSTPQPLGAAIEILPGDTLFRISERYRVALRALVETNQLQPPFELEVGSFIHLPPPNIHVVEAGETLYAISRRYNVDTRSLANMNGLPKPWTIHPNDQILLPSLARDSMASEATAIASSNARVKAMNGKEGPPVRAFAHGHEGKTTGPVVLANVGKLATDPAKQAADTQELGRFDETPVVQPLPVSADIDLPGNSRGFLWPVEGNVVANFGANAKGLKNDGVNIGAAKGAPIKAAADGYVVYAGNELPGFGFLVLINHGDGWVSAYAHANDLLVEEGQAIRQGQIIAKVGDTGSVDTPQLHFQLRKGKSPLDPTGHLSPKRAI